MTVTTRRILSRALLIAATALMSGWITAGAATPSGGSGTRLPTMHFRSVPISQHTSPTERLRRTRQAQHSKSRSD
jgi:hypothetical protein